MRPLAAGLLMLALAAPAHARSDPAGGGRAAAGPVDPAFEPVLRKIETKMPAYDEVAGTMIRVPARTIELGPSARMYRCWKLRLTGDHGKQALRVFERLHSVQSAVKDLKEKLAKDLIRYAGSPKPHAELQKRIEEQNEQLGALLTSYRKLIRLGTRNGLLKHSDREMFSGRRSVTPRLKDDDYTMVYDEANPECRSRPSGR